MEMKDEITMLEGQLVPDMVWRTVKELIEQHILFFQMLK